jgi:nucleoid DNA-binding protein
MAKAVKKGAAGKPRSKSEIFTELAEQADISRKQVATIFAGLGDLMKKDLTRGPKKFVLPGWMKIEVRTRPATKAHMGVNRFTGEEMMFKAKPARKVVKIRPLKGLKDMIG